MHYYRKAAAIFILVLTLILPLFLEQEELTAVVNLEQVVASSSYLSQIKAKAQDSDKPAAEKISLTEAEAQIMEILETEAAELAALNSYGSILIDQAIYKGGKNISQELAAKIDEKYR